MPVLLLVLAQAPVAGASLESPVPLAHGSFWEYRESYAEHRDQVDAIEEATTRFEMHRGRVA